MGGLARSKVARAPGGSSPAHRGAPPSPPRGATLRANKERRSTPCGIPRPRPCAPPRRTAVTPGHAWGRTPGPDPPGSWPRTGPTAGCGAKSLGGSRVANIADSGGVSTHPRTGRDPRCTVGGCTCWGRGFSRHSRKGFPIPRRGSQTCRSAVVRRGPDPPRWISDSPVFGVRFPVVPGRLHGRSGFLRG